MPVIARTFYETNTGDTAWVLASAALVLIMTPGLAFFYGGMVRAKNVLTMLMQNFVCIGIVSVLWVVVQFSLAFGKGNGLIGDFHYVGLGHMIANTQLPGYSTLTIPPMVFSMFQLMFAVITPALITGAIAVLRARHAVVARRVRAHRALGVQPRGLAVQARCRGLRGRDGRPRQRRSGGPRARDLPG
jgi:hypothetical protein